MATAAALYVDGEDVLQNSGWVLGNLTVVQALFRDLLPGGTRKGILRKAAKGLAKKSYLTCDPKLQLTLISMMGSESISGAAAVA